VATEFTRLLFAHRTSWNLYAGHYTPRHALEEREPKRRDHAQGKPSRQTPRPPK
jgi:hypothetical protein